MCKQLIHKANWEKSAWRGTTPRPPAAFRCGGSRGGWWGRICQLSQHGRQGNTNRLKHAAGAAWCLRSQQEVLVVLFDGDLLDANEVADDVSRFRFDPCCGQSPVKFLTQRQRKK